MWFAVMKIHLCCDVSLTLGVFNCLRFEDGYLSVWVECAVGVFFYRVGFLWKCRGPFSDDDFSFCYLFSIELMDLQIVSGSLNWDFNLLI